MTEYSIAGEKITISTELENECYVRRQTDPLLSQVGSEFDKWYARQGDCISVCRNYKSVLGSAVFPLIEKAVEMLNSQGVYSVDENIFFDKYISEVFRAFLDVLDDIEFEMEDIDGQAQEEREYRQLRKESRGRVVGGGFGVGGAIKGMATAGVMNATTGVAHSIWNAAGNMGSGIAAGSSKASLYKNSKEPLREALVKSAYKVRSGIRDALEQEANMQCRVITVTEHNQAEAILQSYAQNRIPKEQKLPQILKALMLNPFYQKTYEIIWKDYGDKNGDLRRMSTQFGGDLEQKILTMAETFCRESFEKNCAEFIKMYDKLEASFLYEENLKTFVAEVKEYCSAHDVEEDTIEQLKVYEEGLRLVAVEKRTVHGIEYGSEELAERVRNDDRQFYRILDNNDIFATETEEKVKEYGYQTEEFKSLLEGLLEKEKNLRTPEKIYENIYKLLSENLTDKSLDKLSIDIPNYMGAMQQKEAMIRSVTMMEKEELPLMLIDRSANGKSGIVLTNQYLRIYAKGVFSNENRMIPLGQIEGIKCVGADQYEVVINGSENEKMVLKQKNCTRTEYHKIGETVYKCIRLIRNLGDEKRKNLFRILYGTVTCNCGMKLLQDETVCPGCHRILQPDGMFAETQICPNCGNIIIKGKKFCTQCGMSVDGSQAVRADGTPEEKMCCPGCGRAIKPGKKFCSFCGMKL